MKQNTTQRLLDAAKDIWADYHAHPFVRGIADGTLDREKFKHYMVQDYLYLLDYARVFALGVAKARDRASMALFAGYITQILNGEMDIHRGYMERLGISLDEAERTPMAQDNLSYVSYMLRIAYKEGPGEIAAAILSCALSYEVIAKEMTKRNPACAEHPFYGEWVRGYASSDYAAANEKLAELTKQLTSDYSEARLRSLEEIFIACSRYEGAFWDMAWELRT
ncbi:MULTISPECIES: thiaminase II [unclassified Oscillibacter]|uniref:thiaminase II n=1 Tax=unclassified Oscillibacter TaxID=2629304 RepID=UPI0025ED08E8|nr:MULTISPECIES: thiaminase II [unclassified Oscillibacter]